jgi:hypothetical protein
VQVLDRYRQRRRLLAGAGPEQDGPAELLADIESCGGPEGFANALGNHWPCLANELEAVAPLAICPQLVLFPSTTPNTIGDANSDGSPSVQT